MAKLAAAFIAEAAATLIRLLKDEGQYQISRKHDATKFCSIELNNPHLETWSRYLPAKRSSMVSTHPNLEYLVR
jgi:hypothetical protein